MSASKDLVKILKESDKKGTEPYDTEATVKRIDGSTAWVHIPGGVDETPVQLTIGSKIGDKVQVRVSGGRAWLVGNASAPPTDDSTAITINKQTNRYVKSVEAKVDTVQKIAGDTDQYFWHTETGTDTGAHITEIPRERFLADPDNGGGNLLARSNGIAVRDGLTELATFGANGAVIGRSSSYHLDTTANGTFIKKGTTSVLDITAETVSNTKYSYIDSSSNYAFADTSLSVDTTSSGDANAGFLVDGSSSGSGAYASIDAHRTRTKGSVTIEVSDNGEDTTTVDVKNNGIYVNNHSSPIGTVKYAQLTSNKSVPNNKGTMLTSISLEAGVWVVACGVRWATNNNGWRRMNLTTTSGATDIQCVVHPVQSEYTQAIFTRILEVESTTTYYLNAYQNSGSSINALGAAGTNYGTYITAVRII